MNYFSILKTTLLVVVVAFIISSCGGNCDSCEETNYKSVCPVLTKTCSDTVYTVVACDNGCCVKNAERIGCDELASEAAFFEGTTLLIYFSGNGSVCDADKVYKN